MPPAETSASRAVRATVRGTVQGVGFRAATVRRARELGVLGWVRNQDDGTVHVHAEADAEALTAFLGFLGEGPPGASVDDVEVGEVKVEGHEQFATRGVDAGRFAVVEQSGERGGRPGYVLTLEVDGAPLAWRLAKAPSMHPADKRMAFELGDTGGAAASADAHGAWDAGTYEQGGRVPWPEAIQRGHAVFVLHGEQLRGGFALQRIRGEGASAQWLLVKRRDADAAAG